MTVYNKSFLFIGTAVFAGGVYVDNVYNEFWVLGVILMALGTGMVLWSMKKPKNYKNTADD